MVSLKNSHSLAAIDLGEEELSKQKSEPEVFRHQVKLFSNCPESMQL